MGLKRNRTDTRPTKKDMGADTANRKVHTPILSSMVSPIGMFVKIGKISRIGKIRKIGKMRIWGAVYPQR